MKDRENLLPHPARGGLAPAPEGRFDAAVALHKAGQLAAAEALYRQVLAADPAHADSLHMLGLLAHQAGDAALAAERIGAALRLRPGTALYHCNLGGALLDLGRTEEALGHLQQAQRLQPGRAEFTVNVGSALLALGRLADAAASYRTALALRPDLLEARYNLGNVLVRLGHRNEAEQCFRACLRQQPDAADCRFNLGHLLLTAGRAAEAVDCFRAVLRLRPDFAQAHTNLGIALQRLNHLAEACACYGAALRLAPDDAEVHYNLGCALLAQNRREAAAECYGRALQLKPDHGAARFALCRAQLPILYATEAEIAERRRQYETSLRQLAADLDDAQTARALADGIGASPPFFLAYQGQDDRELQAIHGGLVARMAAQAYPAAALPPPPRPDRKLRVGIVSGFFHQHTVWSLLLEGWLTQLDRRRFTLLGFHTGTRQDEVTAQAAALCDEFTVGCDGQGWRQAILDAAPDVLLYPEIGMDPVAASLAAQRLAPVQCASWGHPVTSGLPTIDSFLSSATMEPPDGQGHYTERLVRLPGLGIHYDPPRWPRVALCRADLGLRPTATAFWSGQALYKYLPQHDAVFPRIAREAGDCQFVFIGFERDRSVTELFRARLDRSFAAHGLRAADHCVILPALPHERFVAASGLCDAVLDTIGWSGGKSTLECLTHDPAIVTLPGALMRSRHTAAMLALMGATGTVARTVDEYVAIAVRLARDRAWRDAVRCQVAGNKHRLFRDRAAIAALERYLDQACRPPARAYA